MKRLTARSIKNNMAYLLHVNPNEQEVDSRYPNTLKCIMDSFNRLAEYEDTGLTPEEIEELKNDCDTLNEANTALYSANAALSRDIDNQARKIKRMEAALRQMLKEIDWEYDTYSAYQDMVSRMNEIAMSALGGTGNANPWVWVYEFERVDKP